MNLRNIRAEFLLDDDTFIGRADQVVGHGREARISPDRRMNLMGCRIKTGSWQIYSVGYGRVYKLLLVKPQAIEWGAVIHRAPQGQLVIPTQATQ